MSCFGIFHKYIPIRVYHYWDTSYGLRSPSTCVTRKCKLCGKLKIEHLWGSGFVSLEDLTLNGSK